jgi:UDP-N-acetylmuramoyl-tripeptide--D-alanyl-D-alanine ligase
LLQLDLAGVAHAVGGQLVGAGDAPVRGVITDSRAARPSDLFIALDGARTDGHKFLRQVQQSGAAGALVMPDRGERPAGLPCIVVEDTMQALADLARFHLGRLQASVIGVTGTVGKTTAKDFLFQVLGGALEHVHAAPASYNSECGLPLAILGAPLDSRILVLEYGINAPGEMERLLRIARPHRSWITALTPVHLEGMGDLATIVQEKMRLAAATRARGSIWMSPAVAAESEGMQTQWRARRVVVETPTLLHSEPGAFELDLATLGAVKVPLLAVHEAELAAIAVHAALELGVAPTALKQRLQKLQRPEGRLSLHQFDGITVIDDAYNASPDAAFAALEVLRQWPQAGRRIAVLGTMHEMGEAAEYWHRLIGQRLAASGVDALFAVGSGGAWIAQGAREFNIPAWVADDVEAVATLLGPRLQADDVILLKASRAEGLEKILPELRQAAGAVKERQR